ncbi:methionyl-tRNA synthetase [Nematocida parisii]|uniref:methionine--tRNA ligase n=1 Tax=Nematocida parisii (strain ERTm3) TaxID=935791 RepID=I3EJF4_NEMP3|nr:methionyl-tRNA synthetase [Nematocida parisii ERTm1]EIJ89351.1 methionyl-tRNA synthetase [Nematocida parisii ERTm3]KAI5142581.1 methionyl-tRNA synthetase [Nematocida parisii]EIJ94450.1 methionyl-tRNA synthetase [Nematocida parisii ERTm1]KAI5153501.1 methionyl-tRNA synthetase [Nematocida parisii]KAI5156924.1 methionyl-tRNA synthetase [Nematocida parisii]|eukprot:XP_013058946.1 methionyl-tRNA synthetase [Nematocida parisii ERTm1]
MARRIITAALPYVNNLPHLGNIVGSLLGADVYNRYCKMRGISTVFITGTDEYGTASEVSADKAGLSPQELCDINSARHKEVYDWFQINYDIFGRTSVDRHKEITQSVFLEMYNNGYFIEREEERYFCSGCSMFLADRYINGTCGICGSDSARGDQCDGCSAILAIDEIISPYCSTCKSVPVKKMTKHLFFELNKVQDKLNQLIEEHAGKWSSVARQISNDWKNKELIPRCITRDLKYNWGVPVPLPEYKDKVLYVWFDAPIGYITFTDMLGKRGWWTEPDVELCEFMGKDNVFFHSVFFPGMLVGCNQVKYPNLISATHYLTYEGDKFSKSMGRGIFGSDLLGDRIGCAGAWRFHLMRRRPETGDADFLWREFKESYNTILINTIGNLCNRILSYVKKRLNGTLTTPKLDSNTVQGVNTALNKYINHMDKAEIRSAIECIVDVAGMGNVYVQKAFAEKVDKAEMGVRISSAVNILVVIGRMLYPVVPKEGAELLSILRVADRSIPDEFTEELSDGHEIGDVHILFHPLTDAQAQAMESFCCNL